MKEIKCFPADMTQRAKFGLMNSQTKKMSDLVGVTITPEQWILYTDESRDKDGEIEVITMRIDGEIYGTISQPFINAFKRMLDYLGDDVGEIMVISGVSKAGREYISCDIVW